jgi:hypothetical protein
MTSILAIILGQCIAGGLSYPTCVVGDLLASFLGLHLAGASVHSTAILCDGPVHERISERENSCLPSWAVNTCLKRGRGSVRTPFVGKPQIFRSAPNVSSTVAERVKRD